MRPSVAVLALAAACSPRAVTPPGRTLHLDSPNAPAAGQSDAQLGVSRVGTIWGPELVGGEGRIRHAVSPGLVVEGEAGMLHLLNEGSGDSRNALTGRLGLLLRPPEAEDHGARVALMLGVGGGTSRAAGEWASFDANAAIAGTHRWIRPVVTVGGGISRPLGDTTFMVTETDGTVTTLQLPRNLTAQASAGLELGPTHRTLVLGATMTHFWLQEDSILAPLPEEPEEESDVFFALGAAARFALD
jgi:hypothetical protein